MSQAPIERIRASVNHDRDNEFFDTTASLFAAEFVSGAFALLVSHGADQYGHQSQDES
jgi:hypothetical protein